MLIKQKNNAIIKHMKLKNVKKIIISVMLLVVMIFSSACFSDFDPQGNGVNFIGSIEGIKANYRPTSYNYYDFYYEFSKTTLDRLYQTFFYSPENQDLINIYKQINNITGDVDTSSDEWKKFILYFYSDIQYSVCVLKNEVGQTIKPDGSTSSINYYDKKNISWNWDLDLGNDYHYFETNIATNDINPILEFYNSKNIGEDENYLQQLDKTAKHLQAVVLQIILGKTPTVFDDLTNSNVDNLLGTATLNNGNVQATGLMGELVSNGSYVGISDTALQQIKQYILDNVIGLQKFYENNENNNFSQQDYSLVIDTIWHDRNAFEFSSVFEGQELTGCVFDEYPATYVKDYQTNSFFINSDDDIAFEHIQKAEYQSIVIMPSDLQYLNEIWFFLVSDRQFKVNYYSRYYNYEENALYVSDVYQIDTCIESDFKAEKADIAEVSFKKNGKSTLIKLEDFNNEINGYVLKAEQEKSMNFEMAKYFTAEPSQNGFGAVSVLNPYAFAGSDGCSFLEIVFDVVKQSDSNEDFDFKVGMFYYGGASQQDIKEYEKNK